MLGMIGAAAVAAAGALWIYVGRERLGAAGVGLAALRTASVAGLVGLVLNPVGATRDDRPAVVLLDASLSLDAPGARWREALDTARLLAGSRGTLLRFGDQPVPFDSAPPGAPSSRLGPALAAAAAIGGPVVVVTDGELGDVASIPPALRALATMIVLPRDTIADVAMIDVDVPARVSVHDTIRGAVTLAVRGRPPAGDTARVTLTLGARRLRQRVVTLDAPAVRVPLAVPAAALGVGRHAVALRVAAPGDGDARTDTRLRVVEVSALPSVVLIAVPAGWEATFLARELADIVRSPVGAFAQVQAGRWVDLATQRPVPAERVAAQVAAAQLVVRLGATALGADARRRWDWPVEPGRMLEGEWYPEAPPASPLAARLGGVSWDSLPPLRGVVPVALADGAWIGLAARLARRGARRPVVVGRVAEGRRILTSLGEGFWRWALRGGVAREAYRALVAAGADWLLGAGGARAQALALATPVVTRGEPLVFRWSDDVVPDSLRATFTTAGADTAPVLRFDTQGEARVVLEPGVWRWRAGTVNGLAVVEAYAPEYLAAPVVVTSGPATAGAGDRLAGLRERWWLYLVLVTLLLGEWGWRMRKGLA